MNANINHPLLRNFISPLNSFYLLERGFKPTTPYEWIVNERTAKLHSLAFDYDEIYSISMDWFNKVIPPSHIIPAIQIVDAQILIPDYYLERTGAGYTLSCETKYNLPTVQHERMADAFGLMLIECLRSRIITPRIAMEAIAQIS